MDTLTGAGFTIRPLAAADVPVLRRILAEPDVAEWWHLDDRWPDDKDPHTDQCVVTVEDAVVGYVEIWEEVDPQYRHGGLDILLSATVAGRGLGTAVVRRVVQHLLDDRGHHRVTIDPCVDNPAAIRCYEKVGFRPVGVMRQYWYDGRKDTWRDGLLMDLVASDLAGAAGAAGG